MISKNIKIWLNYAKEKGTANANHENRRNIIRMEIGAKPKEKEKEHQLLIRINFKINQLRGNAQKLLIAEERN